MKSVLLIARRQRSINNVLLLSIGLSQKPLHPISVVCTFEKSLACAEHGLHGEVNGQLAREIHQNNRRRLNACALCVQRLYDFPAGKTLVFAKCMSCLQ